MIGASTYRRWHAALALYVGALLAVAPLTPLWAASGQEVTPGAAIESTPMPPPLPADMDEPEITYTSLYPAPDGRLRVPPPPQRPFVATDHEKPKSGFPDRIERPPRG